MIMRLEWLENTRPDCLFEIAQLGLVSEEIYKKQPRIYIRRLNKAIRYTIDNRATLRAPKLDKKSLKLVGFSDASFANNHNPSTHLGYIIFLVDSSYKVVPLVLKSYKARRKKKSAFSGLVIAFSDMLDYSIAFSEDITNTVNKRIPVQIISDSKFLFDMICKGPRTSEKRVMIDIAATREGLRDKTVSDIEFFRMSTNIADGLTKQMSQAVLRNKVISRRLDVVYEKQWIIIRSDSTN